VANDNKGELACARLLPDTPENKYTKCVSEALINDDLKAELECAKFLLPITSGATNNLTNTTIAANHLLGNTSAAIQPSNTSIAASGGKGTGSTCKDNCTGSLPNPVNCNTDPTNAACPPAASNPPLCVTNPNDPSCTQTAATTKTCPDGSVIDANANCPTNIPPSNSPPPSNNPPPPENNPTPPSDNKPSDNGGGSPSISGNGGSAEGGRGSGKGSSSSQPSTLQ
jgi:hypothetical protein